VLRKHFCREALALLSAGFAAVAVLAGGAPQALAAPDTVPTLTGELGSAQPTADGDAQVNCTSAGNGTVTYNISGEATGPYPGIFAESATIVIVNGFVQPFTASFTIDSGLTHIEGTHHPILPFNAQCQHVIGSPNLDQSQGEIETRYEATITGPLGTLTDRGSNGMTWGFTSSTATSPSTVGQLFVDFHSDREASTVVVSPSESVNNVGTTHTVTALIRDFATQPIGGAHVLFTVEGSVSRTGSCTTGPDGTCDFTYLGPSVPGTDLITACNDFDDDGTVDPGETCGTATKAWTEPASSPGQATGGGFFDATPFNRVVFGFGASAGVAGPHGSCGVIDQAAGVHIRCLNIAVLLITGPHASFSGTATQNGIATTFRIDVDDGTSAGAPDTFTIQTDLGYFATGPVANGNINVNPG
jgi:hypothetical protein